MKKMIMLVLVVSVLLVIGCSGSTEPEENETGSSAPLNLTVEFNGINGIELSWDAPEEPDNDDFQYRIYRNESLLTTLSNLQNYYTDSEITEEYTYVITAYYATGESAPSNEESISIQELLIGSWSYVGIEDSKSILLGNDGNFSYSYSFYNPETNEWESYSYIGSYTLIGHYLTCTYTDSNQNQQTISGSVTFLNFNLIDYNGLEWER